MKNSHLVKALACAIAAVACIFCTTLATFFFATKLAGVGDGPSIVWMAAYFTGGTVSALIGISATVLSILRTIAHLFSATL